MRSRPLPTPQSRGPRALPTSRSSLLGDPTASFRDSRRRIPSLAQMRREKRNRACLSWGSAPDPGISQGMTLAFDDSKQQCPGPNERTGASTERHRRAFDLTAKLCTTEKPKTRLGRTRKTTDGEVYLSLRGKSS
jgi:hypothetical protein